MTVSFSNYEVLVKDKTKLALDGPRVAQQKAVTLSQFRIPIIP